MSAFTAFLCAAALLLSPHAASSAGFGVGAQPPWWILNGIKPEGPVEDRGSWSATTFSKKQMGKFGVKADGTIRDKARFDAALAEIKQAASKDVLVNGTVDVDPAFSVTPFCPGSPMQMCKEICERPKCSQQQCAMRKGKCCEIQCLPSPAVIEGSSKEKFFDGTVGVDPAFSVTPVRGVAAAEMEQTASKGELVNDTVDVDPAFSMTPFCPGSPMQICKEICKRPKCSQQQCAMRKGTCCEIQCLPSPAVIEGSSKEKFFDGAVDVDPAFSVTLVRGVATAEMEQTASKGELVNDTVDVDPAFSVTPFCPGSPMQMCKEICKRPKCSQQQCAMRKGTCCEMQCLPSPSVIEGFSKEKFFDGAVDVDPAFSVTPVRGVATADVSSKFLAGDLHPRAAPRDSLVPRALGVPVAAAMGVLGVAAGVALYAQKVWRSGRAMGAEAGQTLLENAVE